MNRNVNLVYHIIGPLLASIILFIFIFLLQDLLFLREIFEEDALLMLSFISLWVGMTILSWILPTLDIPADNEEAESPE